LKETRVDSVLVKPAGCSGKGDKNWVDEFYKGKREDGE
jgi:hypothetical protein